MIFFRKPEEQEAKIAPELRQLKEAVPGAQLPEHVAGVVARELERLEKTASAHDGALRGIQQHRRRREPDKPARLDQTIDEIRSG